MFEFVLPHNYLNYLPTYIPFTVPATSSLPTAAADVATVTTAAPTETAAGPDGAMTYSMSSPFGFLLYVAAQAQKLWGPGTMGALLFSGPTRSYWILTVFMVCLALLCEQLTLDAVCCCK
jgi:hypothetical protein